jgi:hypothetical protein
VVCVAHDLPARSLEQSSLRRSSDLELRHYVGVCCDCASYGVHSRLLLSCGTSIWSIETETLVLVLTLLSSQMFVCYRHQFVSFALIIIIPCPACFVVFVANLLSPMNRYTFIQRYAKALGSRVRYLKFLFAFNKETGFGRRLLDQFCQDHHALYAYCGDYL